jgi:hypothetical protein
VGSERRMEFLPDDAIIIVAKAPALLRSNGCFDN